MGGVMRHDRAAQGVQCPGPATVVKTLKHLPSESEDKRVRIVGVLEPHELGTYLAPG